MSGAYDSTSIRSTKAQRDYVFATIRKEKTQKSAWEVDNNQRQKEGQPTRTLRQYKADMMPPSPSSATTPAWLSAKPIHPSIDKSKICVTFKKQLDSVSKEIFDAKKAEEFGRKKLGREQSANSHEATRPFNKVSSSMSASATNAKTPTLKVKAKSSTLKMKASALALKNKIKAPTAKEIAKNHSSTAPKITGAKLETSKIARQSKVKEVSGRTSEAETSFFTGLRNSIGPGKSAAGKESKASFGKASVGSEQQAAGNDTNEQQFRSAFARAKHAESAFTRSKILEALEKAKAVAKSFPAPPKVNSNDISAAVTDDTKAPPQSVGGKALDAPAEAQASVELSKASTKGTSEKGEVEENDGAPSISKAQTGPAGTEANETAAKDKNSVKSPPRGTRRKSEEMQDGAIKKSKNNYGSSTDRGDGNNAVEHASKAGRKRKSEEGQNHSEKRSRKNSSFSTDREDGDNAVENASKTGRKRKSEEGQNHSEKRSRKNSTSSNVSADNATGEPTTCTAKPQGPSSSGSLVDDTATKAATSTAGPQGPTSLDSTGDVTTGEPATSTAGLQGPGSSNSSIDGATGEPDTSAPGLKVESGQVSDESAKETNNTKPCVTASTLTNASDSSVNPAIAPGETAAGPDAPSNNQELDPSASDETPSAGCSAELDASTLVESKKRQSDDELAGPAKRRKPVHINPENALINYYEACFINATLHLLSALYLFNVSSSERIDTLEEDNILDESELKLAVSRGKTRNKCEVRKKLRDSLQAKAERNDLKIWPHFLQIMSHLSAIGSGLSAINPFILQQICGVMFKGSDDSPMNGETQEDAHEFLTKLFGQLKKELPDLNVDELLAPQFAESQICECGAKKTFTEDISNYSIPAGYGDLKLSLETLVSRHLQSNSRFKEYLCDECGQSGKWSAKDTWEGMRLVGSPDLIIANIPRGHFELRGGRMVEVKMMTKIVPLLTEKVVLPSIDGKAIHYEMVAMIEHHGRNMHRGHYTTIRMIGNEWWYCDDAGRGGNRILTRDEVENHEAGCVFLLKKVTGDADLVESS